MKPLVLLGSLVLLVFAGCDSLDSITGPDDDLATLSGLVTEGGSPYYPATVAVISGTQKIRYEEVDVYGRYRFRELRPGRYLIVLTFGQKAGVREKSRETIDIVAGPNIKDFLLP